MASTREFKPSFSGGELSEEMFGRIDDGKFQSGAAALQNMIATTIGPAERRPGFEYVNITKNNGTARLIPFTYSPTQTVVIEIGGGYFRFHTLGETLQYSATQPAFKQAAAVTYTVTGPAVFNYPAHPFANGDSVVLAIDQRGAYATPGALPEGLGYGPYTVEVIDANNFYLADATGAQCAVLANPANSGLIVEPNYAIGDLVSFGPNVYYRSVLPPSAIPGPTNATLDGEPWSVPGSSGDWYLMPADLTYEIPNIYSGPDLMAIHYVQSADVMTLVHPNYPPMQLERQSATLWTLDGIVFGQALSPPISVAVAETPGYLAKIASIADGTGIYAGFALITTVANHTLAMGDGVYLEDLDWNPPSGPDQPLDGFYLVSAVPVDGSGNLIPNQLYLMNYSGGNLLWESTGTYSAYGSIQYGTQIFNITNDYVVTAVAADGIQQSAISAMVSVLNNLDVDGSYNTITWEPGPAGAVPVYQFYVYRKLNGLYGYIGTTLASTLSFCDNNIAVDMSITPPLYDPVFASPGNYPGAVSYFQQRRAFGGTLNQPQNLWMTKSGTESDMSYSLPVLDTDRVAIGIAVREMAQIEHIVPLLQLVLLTSSTEISVSPINTDVITPSTIDPRPQSYIGASNVQPWIVNNSLLYCAARGGHVREMGYQWQIGGYVTGDISLRAAHLFDDLTIVDQAFMKCPWQVMWFVSSNGNLLGLTYTPEQQIGAWHHHVTAGAFQSIACVAEGAEDRLYAIISRTVNGAAVNYIERMRTRNYGQTPATATAPANDAIQNCFFVDAGVTFDGTNTTSTEVAAAPAADDGVILTTGPLAGTWGLASTGAIFAYPAQSDVGSFLVLTGSDGNMYRFNIQSSSSTTAADALAVSTIPAGVTFPPTATWSWARNIFTGLNWLAGETVSILGDGAVQPQQVVSAPGSITIHEPGGGVIGEIIVGGTLTLPHPCTVVTLGLPYTPSILTLPLVMQIDGSGQGRVKNINRCWVRLYQSSAIFAGAAGARPVEYKQRTTEPYGRPPKLITDEVEITIPASWAKSGQVYITQKDPLPLTVVGLTLEAAIGG